MDKQGKIMYANRQWLKIVGLSRLGPACDRWISRVHADDVEALRADWTRALSEPGFKFAREFRLRRSHDAVIFVWINVKSLAETAPSVQCNGPEPGAPSPGSPHSPKTAHVRAVVGALTDVTYRKSQEQREAAAAKVIEEKHEGTAELYRREQERFVDVICHEIRNPLNGIVNSLDQLRDGRSQLQRLVQQAMHDGTAQAALLASITKQLEDDDALLKAIDLCAFHQVPPAPSGPAPRRSRRARVAHSRRRRAETDHR